MPILGRRSEWVRYQGRANAALLLLAREMDAEFVEPARQHDFATVRGRTRGCTYELHVEGTRASSAHTLELTVRHFHTQTTSRLDGTGCTVPDLDPALMRAAIEDACHRFATDH